MKIIVMKDRKQHQHALPEWEAQFAQLKRSLRWDQRPWYWVLGESLFATEGHVSVQDHGVFIAPEAAIWQDQPTALRESKWQSFQRQWRCAQPWHAPEAVIVGYSIALLQDPERLAAFNQALEQALREGRRHWKPRPIYVMISGVESVSGFDAYFKALKSEQKQQILGFTFPSKQADLYCARSQIEVSVSSSRTRGSSLIQQDQGFEDIGLDPRVREDDTLLQKSQSLAAFSIEAECTSLQQRLSTKVLAHLSWEAAQAHENADILFFPQALAKIYPPLITAVKPLPLVRGVYFASADSLKQIETEVLAKEAQAFKPWSALCEYVETQHKKIAVAVLVGMLLLWSIGCFSLLKKEAMERQDSASLPVVSAPAVVRQTQTGLNVPAFASIAAASSWLSAASQQSFADPATQTAIQSALQAASAALAQVHGSEAALNLSIQILKGQCAPLNQLEALSAAAPQPVQEILKKIVQAVTRTVFAETERGMVQNWQAQLAGSCLQVIQNPNPDLTDFSHFFSPSGTGGRFLGERVASLVNIQSGQLQERSAYGVPFVLPEFLQQDIVRLLLIHDAFFHHSNTPSLSISLTPMVLSKNLADFSIQYGAQSLFYQNGPRFATLWNWPAAAGDVVVKFVDLNGQVQTDTYSGTWGLIQLFNSASVSTIDSSHFALTFTKGDASATYELSLTQGNFAGVLALQGFNCQ